MQLTEREQVRTSREKFEEDINTGRKGFRYEVLKLAQETLSRSGVQNAVSAPEVIKVATLYMEFISAENLPKEGKEVTMKVE